MRQTFLSKPPGGLYSLPYMSEERQDEEAACLSRAEWWEVLFFIKKLEPKQQMEANRIIQQSLDTQVHSPGGQVHSPVEQVHLAGWGAARLTW